MSEPMYALIRVKSAKQAKAVVKALRVRIPCCRDKKLGEHCGPHLVQSDGRVVLTCGSLCGDSTVEFVKGFLAGQAAK